MGCVAIVDEIPPRLVRRLCAQSGRRFLPDLSPILTPKTLSPGPVPPALARWDLFCSVVDNFGDIGVCWRLARQLAAEHRISVRLWVDDLASAARLLPGLDVGRASQAIDGVEIRHWETPLAPVEPGRVVLAAFACRLPEAFIEAMARLDPRPLWINLEYLSAEEWVTSCHGLPSPHPRLPLVEYFFFPGFDRRTGGVLREADYAARRAAFSAEAFRSALGLVPRAPDELCISLFAYENVGLAPLLHTWSQATHPVTCLVPEGRVLASVAAAFGLAGVDVGARLHRGALTLQVLPFVEQRRYDELLWACDLNFVRGEDSFVRAQWAGQPFVWHIYPQDEEAHLAKLDAFMVRFCDGLDPAAARALAAFWQAWNRESGVAEAWPAFAAALPALRAHAGRWVGQLQEAGELASKLVQFCELKIEC